MRIIAFANCDKALKKGLKALLIFEVDLKEANIASDISAVITIDLCKNHGVYLM